MTNDKITIRQAFMMFILTTLSPAIRLFPAVCARYGREAGWLAPLFGMVVPLVIVLIFSAIYKNRDHGTLGEVFSETFGKFIGKVLLIVYLVWLLILFLVYVRYYSERIVSSLFTSTSPDFFIIAMLAVIFFAARAKISALARFSELSILVFAVVFVVFFVSLLPTLKLRNVLPVTHHDAFPVLRSAYPVAGIWGYITPLFFLQIVNKGEIRKQGVKTVATLAVTAMLMIFAVLGSLGPDAAARMPLPFFKVSKLVDIMQSFDRFEAVLSSVWVIADFILLAVLVFVITRIIKELFGLRESKYLSGPVVLLGYAGSLLLAAGSRELDILSESPVSQAVSLTLCLVVPALSMAVGKLRGKL